MQVGRGSILVRAFGQEQRCQRLQKHNVKWCCKDNFLAPWEPLEGLQNFVPKGSVSPIHAYKSNQKYYLNDQYLKLKTEKILFKPQFWQKEALLEGPWWGPQFFSPVQCFCGTCLSSLAIVFTSSSGFSGWNKENQLFLPKIGYTRALKGGPWGDFLFKDVSLVQA